jgi:hypothetical protein
MMVNQYQKEFQSFKKRMGKFSFWFNSLDDKRQWDLIFLWKKHKWNNSFEIDNTSSLKKFLHRKMKSPKYWVSTQKIREQKLNNLIK